MILITYEKLGDWMWANDPEDKPADWEGDKLQARDKQRLPGTIDEALANSAFMEDRMLAEAPAPDEFIEGEAPRGQRIVWLRRDCYLDNERYAHLEALVE